MFHHKSNESLCVLVWLDCRQHSSISTFDLPLEESLRHFIYVPHLQVVDDRDMVNVFTYIHMLTIVVLNISFSLNKQQHTVVHYVERLEKLNIVSDGVHQVLFVALEIDLYLHVYEVLVFQCGAGFNLFDLSVHQRAFQIKHVGQLGTVFELGCVFHQQDMHFIQFQLILSFNCKHAVNLGE